MKRILKKTLMSICYYSGLFEIIRKISVRKGYVPILLYHRVTETLETKSGVSCFSILGIGISESFFDRQMAYLSAKYRVISLERYARQRAEGLNPAGSAVITFDDGFRDFGRSILKKFRLPATVFLIGKSFEKVFWRHLIFVLLDEAQKTEPEFKEGKEKALRAMIGALKDMPEDRRPCILEDLRKSFGVSRGYAPQDVYLTEEEIKELLRDGISFGAHSMSHADLLSLSRDEGAKEVEDSCEFVRRLTGESRIPFAIPFGRYNEEIVKILKQNEVLCNVTSARGLNSARQDLYHLNRLFVNTGTFHEFVYKVSGAEMLWERFLSIFKPHDR